MVWPIGTSFSMMTHIGPPNQTSSWNFELKKKKNPRWRTPAILKKQNISSMDIINTSLLKTGNKKANINVNKLAPYGTDGRLLLTVNFKVTWHKYYDKNKKSGPDKLQYCPLI